MLLTTLDDDRCYTLEELADAHGLTLPEFSTLLSGYGPLPIFYRDGMRGWELKALEFWHVGGSQVGPEHNSYYLIGVNQYDPEL